MMLFFISCGSSSIDFATPIAGSGRSAHDNAQDNDLDDTCSRDSYEDGENEDEENEDNEGTDVPTTNTDFSYDMILVPSGSFLMGSPEDEQGRNEDLETQHEVQLTHDIYLGTYAVTKELFTSLMGYDPSGNECGSQCPMTMINWYEVAALANIMSEIEGLTPCFTCDGEGDLITCDFAISDPYQCNGYRMPTESEWEYAARAGEYHLYSGSNVAADVGWYWDNTSTLQAVGQLQPNAWGFYDMTGNIFEWCWDLQFPYPEGPVTDPVSTQGEYPVFRGGGWHSGENVLRVAARYRYGEDYRADDVGVRLARTIIEE